MLIDALYYGISPYNSRLQSFKCRKNRSSPDATTTITTKRPFFVMFGQKVFSCRSRFCFDLPNVPIHRKSRLLESPDFSNSA
uniref:Uncharacterized protein n=1 Tax=Romanomermis culicivorax TaxID=13658 RepID=A0A915IWH5_ROMCU